MSVRRLLVHTSRYSIASLLTTLAGLVSFPFLTRIFSVSDYGLMNLISATLTALVAVGKLGLQQSIVRLHSGPPAMQSSGTGQPVPTAIAGMVAMSLTVASICLLAVLGLPWPGLQDSRIRWPLLLASALIPVQVAESAFVSILRAEQRTGRLAAYQVIKKYLGLSLVIGSLVVVGSHLWVFYSAQVATEVTGLVLLAVTARSASGILPPHGFSRPLLVEMLRYGVPLMLGWELAGVILSLGDRYLIQALLGSTALGNYAAAYNLCQYIEVVLLTPWGLALTPMYLQAWNQGGADAARSFLERSLRYYVLLGAPIIAGMAAVGRDLLVVLASEKFAPGASSIPLVIAGLVAAGAVPIMGAGLFIGKQTWIAARYVILSVGVNVGLNWALIPSIGIQGAAIATMISYTALLAWMARAGATHLRVAFPWITACRAALAAAAMYLGLALTHGRPGIPTVTFKVVVGVMIYSALILAVEPTARQALHALVTRARVPRD